MAEKMTLEQVRDSIRGWEAQSYADRHKYAECRDSPSEGTFSDWADAIDANLAGMGEPVAWTDNDKSRAFEWLRAVATADDAPDEAGIALDTWHALASAPAASPAGVPDGWKLAMFVLQSGMYAKLPEEERAVCDALIAENPFIAAPSAPEGGEVGL